MSGFYQIYTTVLAVISSFAALVHIVHAPRVTRWHCGSVIESHVTFSLSDPCSVHVHFDVHVLSMADFYVYVIVAFYAMICIHLL